MVQTPSLHLVAIASVMLLASPAQGQSPEEIEKLIAAVSDEDAHTRMKAVDALRSIGPKAATAIPALIAALSGEDANVRIKAAGALGSIGPKAATVVPALIAALSDEDANVRFWSATALGSFGSKAAPAFPALIALQSDDEWFVREGAASALSRIGRPAIPALIVALSDERGPKATPPVSASGGEFTDIASALSTIGTNLKEEGTILWWVVPQAYLKELVGLLTLLVAWFAVLSHFPRHRPASTPKHLAVMALTAAVPVTLACSAVYHAITREWAQGFLPDAVTVVPFPVAAVLSVAFACALPAVWVCQRKSDQIGVDRGGCPPQPVMAQN